MKNWKLLSALLLACATLWLACGEDYPAPSNGPNALVTFTGRVIAANNQPVVNAQVSAGDEIAYTDVNGVFRLPELKMPARNAILRVQKAGYFAFSRAYVVENKSLQNLTIQLLEKQLIHSFSAAQSSTAETDNGARINFPANAVTTSDGNAYSGTVRVYAQYLDPTAPDLDLHMPGDLRGISLNGDEQTLATFGMLGVELETAAGEVLQIAAGQEVEINLPIPSEKLAAAPATIPLWHYDDATARWVEEGFAEKIGDRYIGKVSHFSFWNCDVGLPLIHLSGKLFLENIDQSLVWAEVQLTLLSKGWKRTALTDNQGCFGGQVPQNETFLMEIFVQTPCGKVAVYSQTIGPFQNDVILPNIIIQQQTVPEIIITGNLENCNGQAVQNGYALITSGFWKFTVPTEPDGSYSLTILTCTTSNPITVVGYDLDALNTSQSNTFNNPTSPLLVGPIQVCTPVSEYIEIILDGQSYKFLENVGRELVGAQTNIFAESIGKYVIFSFENNQQTGTFPLDDFYAYPGADTVSTVNINTTITQFGPQGQQIIGTLSGTIQSNNGQTHTVSGNYRVNY